MTFTLMEIASARFRTTKIGDDGNGEFRKRLGLRERYAPARLAIARSLAVSTPADSIPDDADVGKDIRGETLFGSGPDLAAWVSLIVERVGRAGLTRRDIQNLVAAHWHRGIALLENDWKSSEGDLSKFVSRLSEAAGLPRDAREHGGTITDGGVSPIPTALIVSAGEIAKDKATGEAVSWAINARGGSPHSAIMGGVGSGKTRTAVSILKAIRAQAPIPLLAFDFKGDLDSAYHLDQPFDATVIHPPRQSIPLDVLAIGSSDPVDINQAAERFRESFARVKQAKLGSVQADALREATVKALRAKQPVHLSDIRDFTKREYLARGLREDGAIATLNELCAYTLFTPEQSPAEFFAKSWLISMPATISEPVQRIVLNMVLDALDRYINSQSEAPQDDAGNRAIRGLCMIDEAARVLETRLPSLGNLIRMSRSKGGAIMLVSQSPNDFENEDNEFLDNLGFVMAFATNAKPGATRRIFGRAANLSELEIGAAYLKQRGEPTRLLDVWSL